MTRARVLTIILNYRTAEMTLRAARTALIAMDGIAGEIIIVDNASGDGSVETISAGIVANGWDRTARVRLLASDHNGGYGAGNNLGIRAGFADGTLPDHVYILNSDAFPKPDAAKHLLDHLEAHPSVGLAGSHIHGEDGTPHRTAFRFPSALGELEAAACTGPITRLLKRHVIAFPIPPSTGEVDWLAGASVMIRRAALDQIGLFDEGFFLYFEETDLCRRAQRAGWSTVYVRESEVMHIGSVSTGMSAEKRTPGYWFDSRLRYFVKNHGALYAAAATCANLAGGLFWRARAFATRRPTNTPPRFLRDLLGHAARALLRQNPASRRTGATGPKNPPPEVATAFEPARPRAISE